jgi:hypothetical protein
MRGRRGLLRRGRGLGVGPSGRRGYECSGDRGDESWKSQEVLLIPF